MAETDDASPRRPIAVHRDAWIDLVELRARMVGAAGRPCPRLPVATARPPDRRRGGAGQLARVTRQHAGADGTADGAPR